MRGMTCIVLFNKPYGVLTQFTDPDGGPTLADFIDIPDVYAAGRLDKNSEGLMVLTDSGKLQARIASPRYRKKKHYWVQVEGEVSPAALENLRSGVTLNDGMTRPAQVDLIEEPLNLWQRDPPIRVRKTIPTQWLDVVIDEGRNRQIRRMTAAVKHPTLRLIRHKIDQWSVDGLTPGDFEII